MAMTIFTPGPDDIVHKTSVEFVLRPARPIQTAIHIVQYDKGLPIIEVELYRYGLPYTLPADANVWLRWGVKDHIYTRKLTMVSEDRKKIYFRVTYNMAYFNGVINPILVLEFADGTAGGSSDIPVIIDRNPIQYADGPAAPEDEILEQIVDIVHDAEEQTGQDVIDAQAARDAAISAKNDAESARDDAISAKDDAVAAKNASESARDTAISAKDDAVAAKEAAANSATEANDSKIAAESARDDAISAKNDAVAAKEAAEAIEDTVIAAKTDAESARDDAISAKNDAVSAKEAAEASEIAAAASETAAEGARDTAISAKDDAVAAKTAAESARDTAVTAKDDAVSAKNDAESARDTAVTAKDDAVSAKDTAVTAKNDAVSAKDDAVAAKTAAESARDTAVTAKNDAVAAKTAAESARDTAVTAKNDAVSAKTAAESARDTAVTAKDDAVAAKTAAESARDTAVSAKDDAVAAKTVAESARDTAVTAKNDAVSAKNDAVAAKEAAEAAAQTVEDMVLMQAIADEYSSSKAYTVGELLTYDSKLYKCIAATSAGTLPTDTTHFIETSVDNEKITYGSKWYDGSGGVGEADVAKEIYSDRQIDNPEVACPPITFGVAGGEAEIQSGLNKFETLYGNSKVWNQLIQNGNFTSTANWTGSNASRSVSNNILSFTASAKNGGVDSATMSFVNGHKYILSAWIKTTASANNIQMYGRNSGGDVVPLATIYSKTTTDWQQLIAVETCSATISDGNIRIRDIRSSGWDAIQVKNVQLFDLTAMNYPMSGLTNAQIIANFKKDYPLDYYDYNAGTILSAKSASLISRMKNQCSGLNQFIRVLPNTEYELTGITTGSLDEYDANQNLIQSTNIVSGKFEGLNSNDITLTANTYYVKIQATTYSDIMFYNTFADNGPGSGVYGEPYVPYEEDIVEFPNIELRSVGDVRDEAYQTSGGLRKIGSYTFTGNETWTRTNYGSFYGLWCAINNYKWKVSDSGTPCRSADYNSYVGSYTSISNKSITLGNIHLQASVILIRDDSITTAGAIKTFMTGKTIYFPLATSNYEEITTTENPGWKEYTKVDNFGTFEFTTDPAQVPQVEQPYFIKYTVNLAEFLDSAYVRAGGDANNLALLEDIIAANIELIRKLEDGEVIPALAENFNTKMTIEQETPYSFRTAGGSSEIITPCRVKKIKGASVVWNQLAQNSNFTNTSYWSKTNANTSVSDNVMTVIKTESDGRITYVLNFTVGHKYLLRLSIKGANGVKYSFNGYMSDVTGDGNWFINVKSSLTATAATQFLVIGTDETSDFQPFYLKQFNVFDLTLMFGPGKELSYSRFKSLFPKNRYNTTTTPYLLNVTTSGKKYVGFNAYNNETGIAKLAGGNKYQVTGTYTTLSFTDINGAISTPTLDENNCFTPTLDGVLTITGGNATDTCVNLYWDDSREGDFEVYKEHIYPTDNTVELRGNLSFDSQTGNVVYDGDTYGPDGTITREYIVNALTNIPQWNQLLNPRSASHSGLTSTYDSSTHKWHITGTTTAYSQPSLNNYTDQSFTIVKGHSYFVDMSVSYAEGSAEGQGIYVVGSTTQASAKRSSFFFTATENASNAQIMPTWNVSGLVVDCTINRCYVFDLTEIYGAGNEPNTSGKFNSTFPTAYYAYKKSTTNTDGAFKFNYLTADYTNYLYKLITPTTEETQATPYSEVQVVDNWGTEEWLTSGDAVLPVGNYTIYLPDLKAKVEADPEAPENEGYYILFRDGNESRYILAGSLSATQEEIDEILALLE